MTLHEKTAKSPIFALLLLFVLLTNTSSFGQFAQRISPVQSEKSYPPCSIDFNIGGTFSYIDGSNTKSNLKPAIEIGGIYQAFNWLGIRASIQKGWLSAGEDVPGKIYFKNSYLSGKIMGRIRPVRIFAKNYDAYGKLPKIYVGAGVGFLYSNSTGNTDVSWNWHTFGHYKYANIIIPVEAGLTIPTTILHQHAAHAHIISLNLNYQGTLTFTDKLDTYTPKIGKNQHNDVYGILSLGIVYSL